MNHSLFDLLRNAVVHYGYWAVGVALLLENVGIPLPGEPILLFASFLAFSEHDLQLPWIMVVATVVSTVGGSLGFAVGHYGGRPLLDRYQNTFRVSPSVLVRGERLFSRFGAFTIFFARFVFGLRVIAGPLAGVLRMPWRTFLLFNFLGAAVWAVVISSVGYMFGHHWATLMRDLKRFDVAVLIAVLLTSIFWWWRNRRQNGTGHPPS